MADEEKDETTNAIEKGNDVEAKPKRRRSMLVIARSEAMRQSPK